MADGTEKHLFISYAHRDNEASITGQKGWIEVFQQALKVRLGQLLGTEPKIWWDHAVLRGNEFFAGVIDEGVSRSAVLVPVVSPSYRNSDWCRRELDAFCAAAEKAGSWKIGDSSRIFKVVKTPVPFDEQPSPLPDLLGYEFYRHDEASGRPREFHLLDAARIDPQYLQKIDDLAADIRRLVEEMMDSAAVPSSGAAEEDDSPVIYLAESTYDLADEREQIRRFLRQRAYTVLPDRPLASYGPDLRREVTEFLQRARLSIHPVGRNYGRIPEAETASVVEIQNELAAERTTGADFCRLIWMPPALSAEDPRQRELIERLQNSSEAQRGAEILPTTLERLESVIEDKLRPPPARDAARADGEPALKYVYLVCDRRDLEAAEVWRDWLFDQREDLEVLLPLFDGDEADLRADHQENLRSCDGVLLFYGAAPEAWLRARLLDLRKAPGYGRERPFAAKGVLLADPRTPGKERYRTREAEVLRGFGEPATAAVSEFLHRLGVGETG